MGVNMMARTVGMAVTVSVSMVAMGMGIAGMVVGVMVCHGLTNLAYCEVPAKAPQRTVTVGTTDMPGPSSISGRLSNTSFTGMRCTTFT